MQLARSSGIILHPTSFPGPYGIGSLGEYAFQFIDFLHQSKQSHWQVLPLGPTGYGNSPYQSFSSFAGNPLLIDPGKLVHDGFLTHEDLDPLIPFPGKRVDYREAIPFKMKILKQAFAHFCSHSSSKNKEAFEVFCRKHKDWLEEFSLFMALKSRHLKHRGGVWNRWPPDIVRRKPSALVYWRNILAEEIQEYKFQQFLFFTQWLDLKNYANERNIQIIGDIPIFVAYDSTDVWAHQDFFLLNKDGEPRVVAGVPPDYFSVTGQRWGNPIYNWAKLKASNYSWWIDRIRANLELVDIIRLDHFRGFDAYWEIPATEETAVKGRWVKGPRSPFFKTIQKALGRLPLIAEDLGVITPAVERLRDKFAFPGMKVLQFAFNGDSANPFLPHNFSPHCIVYTGTHDNDTTLSWYKSAGQEIQDQVCSYLAQDGHDIAWDLIRLAYASVADIAMIPMQDIMGLGSKARMNFPSKTHGNWQWRYTQDMLTEEISCRLQELVYLYNRFPSDRK